MTEDKILEQLTEIFSEIFRRDDLVLLRTTTAKDVPGWDSFYQVEIALAIEEQMNIKLRTSEMNELKNVGELVKLVAGKLKGAR